jgi:hypothetical protein
VTKKILPVLLAVLAFAASALARDPDTRFILTVRPGLAVSRATTARALWDAVREAAAAQGFRAKTELDDEEATIEHLNDGSPDTIVYKIELGEIKRGHDDADFDFIVRCRAIDKVVLAAELSWVTDADGADGERHVALYRTLARRSDLFVQYGK